MLRVVVVLVALGVQVYALVDCLRSGEPQLRHLPKPVWLLLILLLPLAGAVAYLVAGRAPAGGRGPAARPLAPDDDPEFLGRLDLERRRRLAREQPGGPPPAPSTPPAPPVGNGPDGGGDGGPGGDPEDRRQHPA